MTASAYELAMRFGSLGITSTGVLVVEYPGVVMLVDGGSGVEVCGMESSGGGVLNVEGPGVEVLEKEGSGVELLVIESPGVKLFVLTGVQDDTSTLPFAEIVPAGHCAHSFFTAY